MPYRPSASHARSRRNRGALKQLPTLPSLLFGRISLQLPHSENLERLVVRSRKIDLRPKIRPHLLYACLEVMCRDTSLLPSRYPAIVIVTKFGLVEGVGQDGRNGEMAFVAFDGAAVPIFGEADAFVEEREWASVYCRPC